MPEQLTIDRPTATEIADAIENLDRLSDLSSLPVEDVQRIFTAAFHIYARLSEATGLGDPFTEVNDITATQVVATATAVLHAQNLEVFELALWQSWGGAPWTQNKED